MGAPFEYFCFCGVGTDPFVNGIVHLLSEPPGNTAQFACIGPEGGTAFGKNSVVREEESSDVFGPMRQFALNKYVHCLLSELFQMRYGDPPPDAFPPPQPIRDFGSLPIGKPETQT